MKDREIGLGAGRADGYSRLPEALALEGPMTASGLCIGQRSPLECKRGDDLIAGAELVFTTPGRWLRPQQLLAGNLGNGPHPPSLGGVAGFPPPLPG